MRHSHERQSWLALPGMIAVCLALGCVGTKPTEGEGPVASLKVSPDFAELQLGGTARFTATPLNAEGDRATACGVEWTTGSDLVAETDAMGLVSAVGVGETVVRATCGAVTGEATVEVTSASASLDTLFYDDFESGSLADAGRWHDMVGGGASMVTAASQGIAAVSGGQVLRLAPSGASISHFVATGAVSPYERLHLSFRMMRIASYDANGGLRAGGIRGSTTQWGSYGVGYGTPGSCPDDPDNANDQEFMFAYVFIDPGAWTLRTYTNWLGQQKLSEDPPTCGGGYAIGSGNDPVATYHDLGYSPTASAWHHYEIEIELNDPGAANGWQRMWVDGVLKIEHLDVVYRTTSALKLWAVTFDSGTIVDGAMYIDDVVVTRERMQ